MTQKRFSFKTLIAAAILVSMTSIGCHVDDRAEKPASDETVSASHDGASHDAAATHEAATDKMQPADSASKGTAKPNPAKKGMKGKATVGESPKMTGAMEADNTGVYANVEVYPSFPGGSKGLQEYFDKNLTYPTQASDQGVEGTVQVMFNVDETGKLSGAHIMGDKPGYGLEDEALRVVNSMPAWNPGKLKGKNVKTRFTLPVSFLLN